MRRTVAMSLVFAAAASLSLAVRGDAGPEKIRFPADWKSHILYTTVDRYDVKQYRELYATSADAVQAMKAGRPLPHGTVLTMVSYKAQLDPQGTPAKDANGRFMKGTCPRSPSRRSRPGGAPSILPTSATASGSTRSSRRTAR